MQEYKTESLMINFLQLNKEHNRSAGYIVLMMVISASYSIAVTASMLTVFGVEFGYLSLALTCVIYSVILNQIWDKRKSCVFKLVSGMLPAVAALAVGSYVKNGIALIGNRVLTTVGAENYTIYLPFSVTCSKAAYATCMTVTVCVLAAWITLLCAHLMRDSNRPGALILMILILAINVMYGNDVSWGWFIVSIIFMMAVMTKTFLEEKLSVYGFGNHVGRGIMFAVCIMVLSSGIMFAIVNPADYERPQIFTNLMETLSERIYSTKYGDTEKQVMPSGDFDDLDNLQFSDNVMLEITADEHESLYLRGFVGSEYTGDGWTEVPGDELYRYSETLYWNHKGGMYGQNMIASATQVMDKKASEKQLTMVIETKGADRHYYYTPYEMTELTDSGEQIMTETMLSDSSITFTGWRNKKIYEIKTLENQVKRYPSLVAQLQESQDDKACEQYLINESHYNALVYDVYTDLLDETKKLLENHLKPYNTVIQQGDKHLNYTLAKQIILDYLKRNVTYSEEIAKRSKEVDFATDFIEISKSGYSVHYATMAVMMFRYYGIPARYVEGYLITPEKVKTAKDNSTISVTGEDAHAWVEYYQDGIGWIPFEVTPPYMDVMEQPEMLTATGSGGVSGQGGGAAMEMAKDNYEPEEPEKTEEKKDVPWNRLFAGAGLLILVAVAVLITVHLVRRKKKLNELNRSFEMDDVDASVINMYAYILTLEKLLAAESEMQIYRIYQKAAFSAEQVSAEDRQLVADCKDSLLKRIIKDCKLRRRFIYRWIKGIY